MWDGGSDTADKAQMDKWPTNREENKKLKMEELMKYIKRDLEAAN